MMQTFKDFALWVGFVAVVGAVLFWLGDVFLTFMFRNVG